MSTQKVAERMDYGKIATKYKFVNFLDVEELDEKYRITFSCLPANLEDVIYYIQEYIKIMKIEIKGGG